MWEIISIFLFAIFIGFAFSDYIIVKKARRYHAIGRRKGYHIHHSVYGIATFLIAPFTLQNLVETFFVIGFGVGIIVEHTIHERFVFIEKEKSK